MNFYEILDVDENASPEEIKRAYRRQARIAHPDTGGDAEKFRKVQEAWGTLGDEYKRRSYDSQLHTPLPTFTPRPSNNNSSSTTINLDDFFFSNNDSFASVMQEGIRRLYEENLRKQQQEAEIHAQVEYLTQPQFPMNLTEIGYTFSRNYGSAMVWGVPYEKALFWKRLDIWLVRFFLVGVVLLSVAYVVMHLQSASGIMPGNVFALALSLIGAILGFVVILFMTWAYRWIRYSVLRYVKRR